MILNLPKEICDLIDMDSIEKVCIGCSKAEVFKINMQNRRAYLKIAQSKYEIFRQEVKLLDWLKGKLNVPEVLLYVGDCNNQFLIMSEIKGENTLNLLRENFNKELIVKNLAKGLKMIHNIDITNCNVVQTLDVKLKEGRKNIEQKLVNFNCNKDKSYLEIVNKLESMRPECEDLVLVHGDYCLPNIIQHKGEISGFIDWGRGGIGDRYQDIGIACRSIRTNFGNDHYVKLFLDEYGLDKYDANKIAYYILLDELF